MITEKSIVRAVGTLNMLTKSGELKWTPENVSPEWYIDNSHERTISPVYDTLYEGKYLRLFKYTYRYYTDEESYVMTSGVKLCFVDSAGRIYWEFPGDRSIYDLYDTVRYKTADIENFLGKLASDNPEPERPLF